MLNQNFKLMMQFITLENFISDYSVTLPGNYKILTTKRRFYKLPYRREKLDKFGNRKKCAIRKDYDCKITKKTWVRIDQL